MSGQELAVLGIGAVALAYVLWRYVVKRRASTCCGAPVCPASKTALPAEHAPAPRDPA